MEPASIEEHHPVSPLLVLVVKLNSLPQPFHTATSTTQWTSNQCSLAAEAELGTLFHNGKEACPIHVPLAELGHPQPATPMT